jgi:hypothetical protein
MKKLNLNLSLAAILVFAVTAWAQGGGGGATGEQGGMANTASGTTTSSASNQNAAATHGNTIEGCVVQQGNDFFIQPTKGNNAMVRLFPQSGQDLSAYAGHTVKVHGSSQAATGAAPGAAVQGKSTNITNRDVASAAQGTNVPNSVTTPDQNPPAANEALGRSGALPQGSEVKTGGGDFMVSSIDDVSSTCNTKGGKHKSNYPESAQPPLH